VIPEFITISYNILPGQPSLVAMWSKAFVCSHLTAGIVGSNPAESMDVHFLCLLCVCVSNCVWTGRQPRHKFGCCATEKKISWYKSWEKTAWKSVRIPLDGHIFWVCIMNIQCTYDLYYLHLLQFCFICCLGGEKL
jgi:hypothetical protein